MKLLVGKTIIFLLTATVVKTPAFNVVPADKII